MVVMKVQLFEKIPTLWKEKGNLHQKVQKPKWSHKSELNPLDCRTLARTQGIRPKGGRHKPEARPKTGASHPCPLIVDPP